MPAPQILEHVDLMIENGDCRQAARDMLAVMAYPAQVDHAERIQFAAAAHVGGLRWTSGLLPREHRWELGDEFKSAVDMPAQQVDGTLRRGMKLVGHRLFSVEVFRHVTMTSTGRRPFSPSRELKFEWDHKDINTLRVIDEAGNETRSSVLAGIRAVAPRMRRLIPVGRLDEKAFKNIQDRFVRPSYPVLHIANSMLSALKQRPPLQAREHWGSWLLKKPNWVRGVVSEGMASAEASWLWMRAMGMIVPFEAVIDVRLIERNEMAA